MDLNTVAQNVLQLLAAEGVVLGDDLGDLESKVREVVLRAGARAIELHLSAKPLGYQGSSRPCDGPGCEHDQKFVGHRLRTLATLLGQVTLGRAYYHCKHCGSSCCPYDQAAGLGPGHESVGLARAASLLAALDPFIPAATLLHELTGQRLGDRTVHRLARKVGSVASEHQRQLALKMAAWTLPPEQVEVRPARLYVAVDGAMVHRSQWNEAKCVCCYWEEDQGPDHRRDKGQDHQDHQDNAEGNTDGNAEGKPIRHSRYAVRFEAAEQFKAYVWSLAMCCGLEDASEVILLGDGAAWIWEHIAGVLGEKTICITDWYHVMEHVWACGNALHGQGTPEAIAWVKQRETMLWEGQYRQLIEQLQQQQKQTRSPPKRQALSELITYLGNQGQRLAYDRFGKAGYDIGSGRVESACKHVVANRMKRSGMIWSDDGAQELLSLRTTYLNGHWDQLWAKHPLAA